MIKRCLLTVALICAAVTSAEAQKIGAAYLLIPPEGWVDPVVPRKIDTNGLSRDVDTWVALYQPSDFNRLRNLSRSPCENETCGVRVVKSLRTTEDVASFKRLVLKDGVSPYMTFAFEQVLDRIGVGLVVSLFDLLVDTQMEGGYAASAADFASNLARGGDVRYAEALRGSGPYKLERIIYYRVRVGDEVRIFPLWMSSIRAEIDQPTAASPEPPSKPLPTKPEARAEPVTPLPKFADCVAWTALLQSRTWEEADASGTSPIVWEWSTNGNLTTSGNGEPISAGYRLRTDPRATVTGCMIQIIGAGNAFIEGFENGTLKIKTGDRLITMKKKSNR